MREVQQFIFGYGSLLDPQVRAKTSLAAIDAVPVNVAGLGRGWFGRFEDQDLKTTYLAASASPGSVCNGVLFEVSPKELQAFDRYEAGYKRHKIEPKNVQLLVDEQPSTGGDIWYYTSAEAQLATSEYPILRSYIDICLNGCLEIEDSFPLAREAKFAETFVRTCTGWNQYWIDDRDVYPPNADELDQLLANVLGSSPTGPTG